ncbi:SdrD B-like domain-containing protein, partial [Staphylococcus simulans]|uniref:SdrD B-like domain-containing protein n=1 Tax=Staphylococcus simulans TaxID=1286 RepID=UPI002902856C
MKNKSNGFDARRQNKYAIRRFTVGTASIIVGATLLFGLGHEARAAEETTSSSQTNEAGVTSPNDNTPSPSSSENTTANTSETNTQPKDTTVDNTTTPAVEENVSVPPTENSTTEATTQPDTTTKAPEAQPSSPEPTNDQVAPKATEGSTAAPKEETTTSAPKEVSKTEAPATTTKVNEPSAQGAEAPTTPVQPTPEAAPTTSEPVTAPSTTEVPQTQKITASEPENSVVEQGNEALAAQAGVTPQDSPDVAAAKLLQQSSQNKDANTVETTAETTPSFRIATRAADTLTNTLVTQTGANVNNLVTITNPQISETQIDPNQSGNFRLTADYVIDKAVKGGDYFTVQMPEYATFNGDLNYKNLDNKATTSLVTATGFTIAEGVYDTNTKTLTYTFTDWVNDKQHISGQFNLTQFTDRTTASKSGTYTLDYDIAGEKYSPRITYNYASHEQGVYPASIGSMITSVDASGQTKDFQQIVYVNPTDTILSEAFLTLAPKDENSNAILDINTTQLHIYKVPNKADLTDSYAFDASKYQDLAPEFYKNNRVYTNERGELEVSFGAISDPYVVVVDSKYDPTRGTQLTTTDTMFAQDTTGRRASFFFGNTFITESSSGTGEGVVQAYKLGDYVWEDINQDGIQETNEKPLAGVKVTLKDKAGQVLQTATTDEYGNYLFNNLVNGDYVVEFETPEGYVATTADAGNDRAKDSNGLVANVTINGADDFTIDSGFYKPVPATYNLGDYVWEDSNKDGIQNSNEAGIAGVTVTLTKPDGTTE